MRFLLTPLLLFSIFWMVSCQKEVTGDLGGPAPENDDTLLKKILVVDSLNPKENIYHSDFIYDGQQRVVKIKRYFIDSVNNAAVVRDEDSTVFFYNGSDRKPYKSVGYTRLTYLDGTEIFHRYDSEGRLAADSVTLGDGVSFFARRYSYNTGYINAVEEDVVTGFPTTYYEDSFVVTNKNFTQAFFEIPPGISALYYEDTYDDKVNPLHKLNIANTQFEGDYAYSKFITLSPGPCPHNITGRKSSASFPLGADVHIETYQFTYNKKGYPVSGKSTSNLYTSEDMRIWFTYGK